MYFANRVTAGRWLAAALKQARNEHPLVLALPRGGVPVAFEIAHELEAPLDVLVVKKIGAPGNPELAIGAVAPDATIVDEEAVQMLGVSERYLRDALERSRAELLSQMQRLRDDEPWPDVRGRTVIVVDDGIATGATAKAAVQAVRKLGATKVVIAAPVCSRQAARELASLADEVVSLYYPAAFGAVGLWYVDFTQTSDQEVRDLLNRARAEREARVVPA
jgi:predicted phosphoribosyltransferase